MLAQPIIGGQIVAKAVYAAAIDASLKSATI